MIAAFPEEIKQIIHRYWSFEKEIKEKVYLVECKQHLEQIIDTFRFAYHPNGNPVVDVSDAYGNLGQGGAFDHLDQWFNYRQFLREVCALMEHNEETKVMKFCTGLTYDYMDTSIPPPRNCKYKRFLHE